MVDQPALRRTYPFDFDRSVEALRSLAFATSEAGGVTFGIVSEPLLREGASGREQPIRVRAGAPLTYAVITLADGSRHQAPAEAVPGGARFFIPEQSETQVATVALANGVELEVEVRPVREWDVSLVHHSHFDIGYTDLQSRVIVEQLAYLDDALRYAEAETTDGPAAFCWSVESIWLLREWIARRTPEVVARFMKQVKAGRIEVAALPFNVHTETCSTEELYGLMRYSADIAREFDLDIPVAYQTDIPGCVAGTVDVLAEAGVKYLAVAHNWAGRSVPYMVGGEHLPRLFRWESAAGNSVLVWMTTSAQGLAYQEAANLGFHDNVDLVEDLLPLYLHNEETLGFPYDDNAFGFAFGDRDFGRQPYPWKETHLRVMSRIADNGPIARRLNEVVAAWNERWIYPQVKITRTQDFFEQIEAAHEDEIQTFVGDWNNWWADGLGSAARHLQMNRGAQERLSQLQSIAATVRDTAPGFAERVDAAWESIELFDEHTWGAALPWEIGDATVFSGTDQWHWKAEKAIRAEQQTWELEQEVLFAVADERGGTGDGSIWVLNTAGAARSGLVRVLLPESVVHTAATVRLVAAATGQEIAFREVNQINPSHRSAGRWLEFWLDNVPASGSARVDVTVLDPKGRDAAADGTVTVVENLTPVWQLDNGRVRVEVSPQNGAITSIRLADGTELVSAASAFGFNAYVHDRIGTRGEFNHLSGFVVDFGKDLVLLADRATPTHVAFEASGEDAVGSWLRYRVYGVGVESITTTLRLHNSADYVDVENRVDKKFTADKESGFFAFPFAADKPTLRYEVSGAVAGSDIAEVPGSAHYMHTVRDWVAVHADGRAATLVTRDAPLVQLGEIALPFAPFPGTLKHPEPGTVFSWIHNNIWDTNFPAGQGWDMVFHYRVGGSAAASPEEAGVHAAQLAQDHSRPLLAAVAGPTAAVAEGDSLITVDDPRVRLLRVTRHDGTLLVALQSLAEVEVDVTVRSTRPLAGANRASMLGVARDALSVSDGSSVTVRIPRFGVAAIALHTAP